MHAQGAVVSEVKKETFARFRSLESGWEFIVTGTQHDDGFELDEQVYQWVGPFVIWEDGTSAKFLGLESLRLTTRNG